MKKTLLALALFLVGCTNEERTVEVLKSNGYTHITTTGFAWGGCGDKDGYCTGFIATSPSGSRVSGQVGCGFLFKGCTIRFD